MKIAVLTPTFFPRQGGTERFVDRLVRGLIGRGHEVEVLTQKNDTKLPEPDLDYQVHRYRRPPKMHRWPSILKRPIQRLHRRFPFEAAIVMNAYPLGYAAGLLKEELGFHLMISPRGMDLYPNYHGLKKKGVPETIAAGYQSADVLIANSHWLAGRLNEVAGIDAETVNIVGNGLDIKQHDEALAEVINQTTTTLASRFGLVEGNYVLHMGRVESVKRPAFAIQSLAGMRQELLAGGWKYVMVGKGKEMPRIEEIILKEGLEEIVCLPGFMDGPEKYWLLQHAKCMVSTSREEGLPNTLIEAMATGLPALVSDIDPHLEMLAAAPGWGRAFQLDDEAAFQLGLWAMLQAERGPMSEAGIKARGQYGLDAMLDGFESSLK